MAANWLNLRSWRGSLEGAFEELCCQLAAYEQRPPGSSFVRKGTPDAGVECLWWLPTGDEWGWQAKFFLSPPDANQWHQLDESVNKALEKHPRLTLYTICLPVDRQDPRVDHQKWFMDRWNDHVEKWRTWATARGMAVEFSYWGDHEIWERLTREEHRGRRFFWFNEESFSRQWFASRIAEAVANAGPRYSPELNVDLPISRLFDGLGRTPDFHLRIKVLYGKIKRAHANASSKKAEDNAKAKFHSLRDTLGSLRSLIEIIEQTEFNHIDWNSIGELASKSDRLAWECISSLEDAARKGKEKAAAAGDQPASRQQEEFGYERHQLYQLRADLGALHELAESHEALLSNVRALLLVGGAGTGKTHLFCDVANRRANSDLPTILLLGGQFSDEEPWLQITRLLGLSCTREEFLGALEAAAESRGSRVLILIDALNEGQGKKLWGKHLAGMLTTLSRYSRVGIGVSVRTSYENTVIPAGFTPHRLVRVVHPGFADHEYEATRAFFHHFGIERPTVPILVPEFQNPLFLKLFCQGLKNRGLTQVPHGFEGITAIFECFVESVNEKLSRPEHLDFDPKAQIVHKAIDTVAQMMAETRRAWLPREDAQAAVNVFLPRDSYEQSLFRNLLSEGVLTEDRFRLADDNWREGSYFAYERFTDHLVVKHLLGKYLDPVNPLQSFLPDQPLGNLVKDEPTCWQNRGFIDALSVQLPERIKRELVEVAPSCARFRPFREAFVESLIWRSTDAFTDATLQYVNQEVAQHKDTHDAFLNALLMVAANPNHPYNADFLHKHLMELGMADRDAWWSVFLHEQYGEHGAVDRLVDWAWSADDKSHIADKSLRLCSMAVAWFLTTSNRFLRDRATKALVSLLGNRIHVLRQIIREFLGTNDPYITERLFAAAYGCAMRNTTAAATAELAEDVYNWIFRDGEPPPHILVRDYARGVVEVALWRGAKLDIDRAKLRPPFKSEWPSEIPAKEELKTWGKWEKEMPDEEWARVHLYESVMGFEDFARYIIGTNSSFFEWSSRRLGEPRKASRKEIYETFVQSLTDRQQESWNRYQTIRANADLYRRLDDAERRETFGRELSEQDFNRAIERSMRSVRKILGRRQIEILEDDVLPYLDDPRKDEHRFDLSIVQCLILQKVLDMGWTVERFGRFDRALSRYSRYGRSAHKPERIGKKYQWIAYHEVLARVADTFEFRVDFWSDKRGKYEGPWQIGSLRNIDPCWLPRRTGRERWQSHQNTWWFPSPYEAWDVEPDDVKWLKDPEDLPAALPLFEVSNPEDGSKWWVLEAYYNWQQPTPPEEERFAFPRREIWYMLKSYIVRKSDMDKLFEWAQQQDFTGRWMPESHELYHVFLGEFFWSPAFEYYNTPYYHHAGWTRGSDDRIPCQVLVSTEQYLWEHGNYDCSIDESVEIYLPCKWLSDEMALSSRGEEGCFFDDGGDLVAFDPSVKTPGPGALLMRREAFLKFLNAKGYDILWTIVGEKNIIGGRMSPDEWKGRLELSGAYRIRENRITGVIKANFRS